jgi:hypothetical protein
VPDAVLLAESVILNVTASVPGMVGVPDIRQDVSLRESPAGRVPAVIAQR